tara:strand:+ start:189 stop:1229 length:1041 start_codon:yes stop_codon:yes gene_type:complete
MEKFDLKNYCASEKMSIRAIAALLNTSKQKTIYILGSTNKLVGSVTDGDLRRAIVNGMSLDQNVTTIMNKNPKHIQSGDNEKTSALILLEKFNLKTIPVVDKRLTLIDIISSNQTKSRMKIDNPVVIMAGGLGSRLMPLTKGTPKPMLEVGGKPILERIIEQFVEQGFYDFYISVYYLSEQIKNYFGDGRNKNINIRYLEEESPMGTGGCLSLLPKPLSKVPYVITNGDILTAIDYLSLIDFHEKNDSLATMATRNLEIKVPFGVIEKNGTHLKKLVEKPSIDVMINAGIYMMDSCVVEMVKNKVQITDVFTSLLEQGRSVHCFPLIENWTDIGHLDDFKNAQSKY